MIASLLAVVLSANVRDESFRLAIASETFERAPYDASLEAAIERPIVLRVGASVHAGRARATLRDVTGDVRFHADLGAVDAALSRHPSITSRP